VKHPLFCSRAASFQPLEPSVGAYQNQPFWSTVVALSSVMWGGEREESSGGLYRSGSMQKLFHGGREARPGAAHKMESPEASAQKHPERVGGRWTPSATEINMAARKRVSSHSSRCVVARGSLSAVVQQASESQSRRGHRG
jgi:hypothetical protein